MRNSSNQAPSQTLQVPGEKVKKKEKKPKKGKKGKKVLTKADISGPQNFKHIGKIKIQIIDIVDQVLLITFRALGRSENPGVPVVMQGHNLPPWLI